MGRAKLLLSLIRALARRPPEASLSASLGGPPADADLRSFQAQRELRPPYCTARQLLLRFRASSIVGYISARGPARTACPPSIPALRDETMAQNRWRTYDIDAPFLNRCRHTLTFYLVGTPLDGFALNVYCLGTCLNHFIFDLVRTCELTRIFLVMTRISHNPPTKYDIFERSREKPLPFFASEIN